MATTKKTREVLVTTSHRGVFFGTLTSQKDTSNGTTVVLKDARCALRWHTTGGFLELAEFGPNKNSKIGATAPTLELEKVTSIADVTPKAAKAWVAA